MTNAHSKKHRVVVAKNKVDEVLSQDRSADNITETLSHELLTLQKQHQDLQLRYSALFNLNQLSQECERLSS